MDVTELGEFVRINRKDKGLTQQDLADLSGVSDRFVRDMEKGKPSAEIGKVIAVLAILGFDLEPVIHRGVLS